LDIPGVLTKLRNNGFEGWLMIEMAHMHPNWPDEDKAVAQSVHWLRNRVGRIELN